MKLIDCHWAKQTKYKQQLSAHKYVNGNFVLHLKWPKKLAFTHLERRPRDLVKMVPNKEIQMHQRGIAWKQQSRFQQQREFLHCIYPMLMIRSCIRRLRDRHVNLRSTIFPFNGITVNPDKHWQSFDVMLVVIVGVVMVISIRMLSIAIFMNPLMSETSFCRCPDI